MGPGWRGEGWEESGETPVWGFMRDRFCSGVSYVFENNAQLNPGKKEISLFKTVCFFFPFL